ncbi:MAG: hypothetical protein HZB91_13555 [Elusimicrobia bacterium]|nr:hypothetical protein [Elusimicrobiota bacterium]
MARTQPNLRAAVEVDQRMALVGRLQMAEWIEMPEAEFAREVEKLEKDPLFRKLRFGSAGLPGVIGRKRWSEGSFSNSLFEVSEHLVPDRQRVPVDEILGRREDLLPKIAKMGQEAFERYFLYAEEVLALPEIARRTGVSVEEASEISDLLLEVGSHAEFAGPAAETPVSSFTCFAGIVLEDDGPALEFSAPYWARGRYLIRYELLEDWKKQGCLEASERKRLPQFLKRLETVNLRQNAIYRVLESLIRLQEKFLQTRRPELMRPISLRKLADRLELAPSTVSRAIAGRAVRMPWGEETPLITLLPGRRRVLKELISRWLSENPQETDAVLVLRLKNEHNISVSRRTVNVVRHQLAREAA